MNVADAASQQLGFVLNEHTNFDAISAAPKSWFEASNKQLTQSGSNKHARSQAGKARSRLNSRKHGLTAKMLIIVGENADDFDQLRAELMAEHDPQSVLETNSWSGSLESFGVFAVCHSLRPR